MKSHPLHSSPCVPVALSAPPHRRGFTLMELMVSVAILVVIILSVGVTFKGAASSVGVSNATIEMTADVRAIQNQFERDVSGIDRNGYIAIRCCLNRPNSTVPDLSERFDQISFISTGMFNNRAGADTTTPFTDSSTASAAHIWLGQGILETANPPANDNSYLSPPNQGAMTPVNAFPTGAFPPNFPSNEMTLMREQTLLIPGPSNRLKAYPNLENGPANAITGTQESGFPAHISSSRYGIVAQTPGQVYQTILSDHANGDLIPEVDLYTYRFRALASVYDTEVTKNSFVNGYFRTTPIMLKGVTSFKIEWTDGKVYPSIDPRAGQLKWYGGLAPNLSAGTVYPGFDPAIYGYQGNLADPAVEVANPPNLNDQYIAIFNYSNRAKWPKALRFTMHIASDRLTGGRDFVQVVNVPQ